MEVDRKTGSGKIRLGDVVHWQKGKPNAHVLIGSKRFVNFLKAINTPTFKIYKIKISNYDAEYFIFHLPDDIYDNIFYPEQIFYKRNVMTDVNEGYIEKGSILNKSDFLEKRSSLIKDKSQTFFLDTIVYVKEFELLWGHPFKLLVTNSIKEIISEQQFVLDFNEFSTYEIKFYL
jgi:hypothetical protein